MEGKRMGAVLNKLSGLSAPSRVSGCCFVNVNRIVSYPAPTQLTPEKKGSGVRSLESVGLWKY